jgi:hypothetical protein
LVNGEECPSMSQKKSFPFSFNMAPIWLQYGSGLDPVSRKNHPSSIQINSEIVELITIK